MSYAVRIDGRGWRAVGGMADVVAGEVWVANLDNYTPSAPTKDDELSALLATRGLTLETEWQLPGIMAGMLAAGAQSGKTEQQVFDSNPGYKNAKLLYLALATRRAAP